MKQLLMGRYRDYKHEDLSTFGVHNLFNFVLPRQHQKKIDLPYFVGTTPSLTMGASPGVAVVETMYTENSSVTSH